MNIQQALEKIAHAERLLQEAKHILQNTQQETTTSIAPSSSVPEALSAKAETMHAHTSDSAFDINTINGLVGQLLHLASSNLTEDDVRDILDKITHVSIDSKALSSLMRYNWTRLKSQVQDYLLDPYNPMSFVIIREQDRSSGNIAEKKLFLEAKSRNPVPITLRKDSGEEHWRIYTFSL